MAVANPRAAENEQLNRFWPRFRRRALILTIFTQFIVTAMAAGIILWFIPDASMMLWGIVAGLAVVSMVMGIITTGYVLGPLGDLSKALVHVSGELSPETPPNLNNRHYERNHLRPLLKMVYELAVKSEGQITIQTTSSENGQAEYADLSAQLNHTSTAIVMLNTAGEIIYANKSAPVHIDGNGKRSLELVFDVDASIAEWLTERGNHDIHAEKVWKRIANKITGEPERRLFDIHVSYEKGSEAETIITMFDRTDEYQPEDDDLDFIAFAAHELRGPITVIRGYLDTLNDELDAITDADQKELFQRLIVSANRLSGYVNNILNASRFDRRHLKIHLNEQTVASIYDSIADDMQMRAVAQQRLLSVQFPDGLPTVAADLNSMSEVMGNLIDNAIKYSSDGGSIEVTAVVDGNFVQVSVADHGIGMPSNVVSNLFHKFYRSHRSRETVAGTGIGLYISKAIVESNGGKIGVRSIEGHGSTFTFSLPIYATVADKLAGDGANNQAFIERSSSGWIRNHGAFRG